MGRSSHLGSQYHLAEQLHSLGSDERQLHFGTSMPSVGGVRFIRYIC